MEFNEEKFRQGLRKVEDAPGTVVCYVAGKAFKIIPTALKFGGAGILEIIAFEKGLNYPLSPLASIAGVPVVASVARYNEEREKNESVGISVGRAAKSGLASMIANLGTATGTLLLINY